MSPWKTSALGEIASIVGGGTPTRSNPDFYGGEIPWVTPKDMKSWEITGSQIQITESGLENSATRVVPKNSILVVVRSGVLKHTIPVGLNRVPVAINQDMKALQCRDGVYADYLARFIKAQSPVILQWVRATTADNFPIDKLRNLSVQLPPLPEQRRIAAVLDQAEALRAKRRTALAELDTLTQSIFLDMFGDPISNTKAWPMKAFGGVCDTRLGKMLDQKQQTGRHQRPYLRNANVQWFRFDLAEVFEMDFDEKARKTFRLEDGDLLICEGGEPGRAAVWRGEMAECYYQKALHRVRPWVDLAIPDFLAWQFWFLAHGGGLGDHVTSATIAHLTGEKLNVMKVPLPPITLQREFASRINAVEKLKTAQRRSLAELDALFASLQHRAFRGEL